jgi:hypothetical protein
LAISRAQKTHAYGVDIPEHDGEKIMTLDGRENPEYCFGGPNFFQFLKKKTQKFCHFLDKRISPGSQSAISRTQKIHAYEVDTPEHDGEIGSTLDGRENSE